MLSVPPPSVTVLEPPPLLVLTLFSEPIHWLLPLRSSACADRDFGAGGQAIRAAGQLQRATVDIGAAGVGVRSRDDQRAKPGLGQAAVAADIIGHRGGPAETEDKRGVVEHRARPQRSARAEVAYLQDARVDIGRAVIGARAGQDECADPRFQQVTAAGDGTGKSRVGGVRSDCQRGRIEHHAAAGKRADRLRVAVEVEYPRRGHHHGRDGRQAVEAAGNLQRAAADRGRPLIRVHAADDQQSAAGQGQPAGAAKGRGQRRR